jgi:hypothetical protein
MTEIDANDAYLDNAQDEWDDRVEKAREARLVKAGFNGEPIILSTGTFRPQDVAAAQTSALDILVDAGCMTGRMRDELAAGLVDVIDHAENDTYDEDDSDWLSYVSDTLNIWTPTDYSWGGGEHSPDEIGFWPFVDDED